MRLTNKFTRKVATRKKSINTPHSDLWVGHDIDATIWLPFFGNLSSSGINFFEPKKITNKFSMTYNSFKEATKNSFFKIKQFHPRLKLGNLYLFDAYCLHGTMQKNNTSYRVSFDSYFRFKKRLPGFKRTSDKKLDSFYIDLKKYSEIGYTKYLNSNMNFLKTKKVFLSKNKKIINPHTFAKLVN